MGVKWKTNENIKGKIDITLYYDHQNMELLNDEACVTTLIATFAFDKKNTIYCLWITKESIIS
jgi:hypothetical protein